MLSRSRLLRLSGNYRNAPKISDEFQHVLLRNRWAFDHLAVDVGYLCAVASRFTRELIGSDRDTEAVKIVQKQIQNSVLRRVGGNKSVALLLDGSEPLWKVQHMRLYPGKRFSDKFYRSAASPMVYLLEEKLRLVGTDIRPAPVEFLVSGAGVPGAAEGKLSAWMLDLATRVAHPATLPPNTASITPNDSVCVVGHTDLFLNAMAATPFHNVTVVTFNAGEVKSLSLKDCLSWLGLSSLLEPVTARTDGGETNSSQAAAEQQQKLAAVRTDVVLLYLMAHGTSATDLSAFSGVNFADLMDSYLVELETYTPFTTSSSTSTSSSSNASITSPSSSSRVFSGVLFDEYPLIRSAEQPQQLLPSLRLKPAALAKVLARAAKHPITFPTRPCQHSANYLEVLLQTHAMFASGGVQNHGWVAPELVDSVPEKPAKVPLDQFIAHLRFVAATPTLSSPSSSSSSVAVPSYVCPTRSRSFALTGLESLLLTSPEPEIIDQVVPMYARGHAMPDGLARDIVETKNVFAALDKARAALGGLVASSAHPAAAHMPTHYLVRTAGARGPPAGWAYHSVNLGLKAEAMNIRYSLNASDTALLRERMSSQAESGLSKRNCLHVYCAETEVWKEVPCDALTAVSDGDAADGSDSTLRVLSWNVQFDRHSGERTPLGRDGIEWCTQTRYHALNKVLANSDADIIAMQEVEPAWCAFLSAQPWVREGYALSCQSGGHAIAPWGVLLLIRRRLTVKNFDHANVPAFSGHTSAMPEVVLSLGGQSPPVTVSSLHLLAPYSQNNVSNRETQLANLVKHMQASNSSSSNSGGGVARIVMGDFNDYPAKFFRFPSELAFRDAWEALHPRCNEIPPPRMPTSTEPGAAVVENEATPEEQEERGYTINGVANPYAGRIIEPEFFGRADRVMYAAKHLQPVHAELVGTQSVLEVLTSEGTTHLVERPPEPIPSYLFPSDHFGVLAEFQVV